MYAQRGKDQIPQFPQLTRQPSTTIFVFVLNFRSSRETQQAVSDLQISVHSQIFSPLLPQGTMQYKLIFSNGQWSRELLGVSVTLKISQHRLQSSRTKHTLFPFSMCVGIIAPWSSHISRHHPLTTIPSESCCLWATARLATEKSGSSISKNRLPTSSALPTQPLPLEQRTAYGSVCNWKWLQCEWPRRMKSLKPEEWCLFPCLACSRLGAAQAIQDNSGALLG